MRRNLPLLLLLALLGSAAAETMELRFAEGKKKTLSLVRCDAVGLTVKEGGGEKLLPWETLAPDSAYEARKSLTSFDDGPGRVALVAFARERRLYPEAFEQLEIALALDAVDEAAFEERSALLGAEELAWLKERIDALLATKAHPRECLRAIKRLRERYPEGEANAAYEPQVTALVELLAEELEAEQAAENGASESAARQRLRADIEKLQAKKGEALAKAEELVAASTEYIEKRVISRIKKTLVEPMGAEKYFKKARTYLRAIAKADSGFLIVPRETLQAEYEAIEKRLVECYLGVTRQLMRDRNYKSSVDYVSKILYYDPIHEEALEMKAEIEKNRIHFKASDITNARPRVTGG